jgi:hypothetical protein
MAVRPIIGWCNPQWEFVLNPIIDFAFGAGASPTSSQLPGSRESSARNNSSAYLGTPGSFPSFQQQHQLFAVSDFRVGEFDFDLGIGCGVTRGSGRWVATTSPSYAFPGPKTSLAMRPSQCQPSANQIALNQLAGVQ